MLAQKKNYKNEFEETLLLELQIFDKPFSDDSKRWFEKLDQIKCNDPITIGVSPEKNMPGFDIFYLILNQHGRYIEIPFSNRKSSTGELRGEVLRNFLLQARNLNIQESIYTFLIKYAKQLSLERVLHYKDINEPTKQDAQTEIVSCSNQDGFNTICRKYTENFQYHLPVDELRNRDLRVVTYEKPCYVLAGVKNIKRFKQEAPPAPELSNCIRSGTPQSI